MEKQCTQCRKLFTSRKPGAKFCSRTCKHNNQRKIKRKRICRQCGTKFFGQVRKKTSGEKRLQFFCSFKCRKKFHNANRLCFDCYTCGKHVVLTKRNGNQNRFCSRGCSSIYASVYTTLSDPFLPSHNLRYKYKAFVFYGFKCERCGWKKDIKLLCVHHRTGKKNGNSVENLEVLCPSCHAQEHYRGGPTWKKHVKAALKIRKLYFENIHFSKVFEQETGCSIQGNLQDDLELP